MSEALAALGGAVVAAIIMSVAFGRRRDGADDMLQREREFSSNTAHQLRTPLTSLRLRLEELTMWDETTPDTRAELLASIGDVDRLARTIDEMLTLSREGAVDALAPVELRAAAVEAATRWEPLFVDAGRTLSVDGVDSVHAAASVGAVTQVLDVLLENSLVHGKGCVVVLVSASIDHCIVRVRDEGELAAQHADHIFERNYRGETSAGSGIGLALARRLAVSSRGALSLAATAPTTFDLSLPRA